MSAPTEAERAACLADTDAGVAAGGFTGPYAAQVREYVGWTDDATGEYYPPHWVVEIRFGKPPTWHVVLEFEDWRTLSADKEPGLWTDLVADHAMSVPVSP